MDEIILLGKALQDPLRIRLLACLTQGELCKCELQSVLGATDPAKLDHHLKTLKSSGLIHLGRIGHWKTYSLAEDIEPLIKHLFHTFESSMLWDPHIPQDMRQISQRIAKRGENWCQPSDKNLS